MRKALQRITGVAMLALGTGCFAGSGGAADLPMQTRPYPVPRAPEGATMARETEPRWSRNLDAALARKSSPVINWSLVGFVMFVF